MNEIKKRTYCPKCQCPTTRCICDYTMANLLSPLPLIILRHKNETNHYLNTAKILQLSFNNIVVFDGEIFNENIFENFPNVKNWILLFPTEDAISTTALIESNKDFKIAGIIILDGTWKKAKKIYYLNSFLHQLPKVKLAKTYSSQYELRKCGKENHLSTLEACVYLFEETKLADDKIKDELLLRLKSMIQRQKNFP